MSELRGARALEDAIRGREGPAIAAYLMAGFPGLEGFPLLLEQAAGEADVLEVGVPFTDPMADGVTIQDAGHLALQNGVTLGWIIDVVAGVGGGPPIVLMGYYNPFLAYGLERLGSELATAGVAGVIVPDLPLDEAGPLGEALNPNGVALIGLVTPATSVGRMEMVGSGSQGFLYAVTRTGITGGLQEVGPELVTYLEGLRGYTDLPVMAGFGVRSRDQVEELAPYVDGVIVGSALLEVVGSGGNAGDFLAGLRPL